MDSGSHACQEEIFSCRQRNVTGLVVKGKSMASATVVENGSKKRYPYRLGKGSLLIRA